MISVLIPVYNTPVVELVKEIHRQLNSLAQSAEIVVIDDASLPQYKMQNRSIENLSAVTYKELPENIGRTKIRKLLSEAANGEWLVFIDGDSIIIEPSFLKNYHHAFSTGSDVILGGRVYPTEKPKECFKVLHWKYGTTRENVVKKQNGFLTNNFCIAKEVFSKLKFNIDLKGYGHEDTLLGIQLKQTGARVSYINNPVLHNGIEDSSVFIEKSLQAVHNLHILSNVIDERTLRQHVKLYDQYCKLEQKGLTSAIKTIYHRSAKAIERNLKSCSPSLFLFDFYRLANFILLKDQAKTDA